MPIILDPVMTRATKRTPAQATNYVAKITPKKSISVSRDGNAFKTFNVGDMAEYDSYNLSYYGTIINISEKTVAIVERHTDHLHRLTIERFCWRNHNFDLAKTQASNSETSQHI